MPLVEYIGTDGDWHQANRIEGDSINTDGYVHWECVHNTLIDMLEFHFKLVCCIQINNGNNISIIHNFETVCAPEVHAAK